MKLYKLILLVLVCACNVARSNIDTESQPSSKDESTIQHIMEQFNSHNVQLSEDHRRDIEILMTSAEIKTFSQVADNGATEKVFEGHYVCVKVEGQFIVGAGSLICVGTEGVKPMLMLKAGVGIGISASAVYLKYSSTVTPKMSGQFYGLDGGLAFGPGFTAAYYTKDNKNTTLILVGPSWGIKSEFGTFSGSTLFIN